MKILRIEFEKNFKSLAIQHSKINGRLAFYFLVLGLDDAV